MKIYIVTSGEYDDYAIEAVFLDKRKAENYCRYHTNGMWALKIEEHDSKDETYDVVEKGFWTIEAELDIERFGRGFCKITHGPDITYGPYLSDEDKSELVAYKSPYFDSYRVFLIRSFSEAEYAEWEAGDQFDQIMQDEFGKIKKLAAAGERLDLLYPDKNL